MKVIPSNRSSSKSLTRGREWQGEGRKAPASGSRKLGEGRKALAGGRWPGEGRPQPAVAAGGQAGREGVSSHSWQLLWTLRVHIFHALGL